MRKISGIMLGTLGAVMLCGAAWADSVPLKATLDAKSEVPPNASAGKGTMTGNLDTATKTLTYTVEYSGLTGPATAGHIHGPADPGANAPPVVPFAGNLASPIKGSAALTDAQIADLNAGKYYVNIHTEQNKGGEIRGQITK